MGRKVGMGRSTGDGVTILWKGRQVKGQEYLRLGQGR
jgi:hypothetical protein